MEEMLDEWGQQREDNLARDIFGDDDYYSQDANMKGFQELENDRIEADESNETKKEKGDMIMDCINDRRRYNVRISLYLSSSVCHHRKTSTLPTNSHKTSRRLEPSEKHFEHTAMRNYYLKR
jgi:hypothetical protein